MSLFDDLLNDPLAQRRWLVIVSPYNGSSVSTLYYSSHGFTSAPTDSPADTRFLPRISNVPRLERTLFSAGRFGGRCEGALGELEFANGDGALDYLRTYGFDGRAVTVKLGGILSNGTALGYSDYGTVFSGTCAGDALVGIDKVVLRLRDKSFLLDRPIQTNSYSPPCLVLNGTTTYVPTNVTCPAGSMALECWFYVTSTDSTLRYLHGWQNSNAAGARLLRFGTTGSNVLQFVAINNTPTTYTASYGPVAAAGWHHAKGILDTAGANIYLYVDGVLRATTPIAGTFTTVLSNHVIGRRPDAASNYFPGKLSECRVYAAAHSAAKVRDELYLTASNADSNLSFCWHLDEGEGSAVAEIKTGASHTATDAAWDVSAWAPTQLQGKPRPLLYGSCLDVEPILVDSTATSGQIYQVHDRKIQAVDAVYDKGQALTPTVQYTVDTNRALVTLVSYAVQGKLTMDVRGDAGGTGYVSTAADVARRISTRHGGLSDPGDLDTASFTSLNTANSSTVGIYIRGGEAVFGAGDPEALSKLRRGSGPNTSEVLSEVINSVSGFWGFDRSGLLEVGRFEAPSGAAVAAYTTKEILDDPKMEPLPVDPPVWRVIVGYARNWSPQSPQELAGILTTNPTRYNFCQNEWRFTPPAQDPSIKTAHPSAGTLVVLTGLQLQSAAETEAARLLALWGVRHDFYKISLETSLFQRDVGDVVTITRPRFGMDSGRDGRLLSYVPIGETGLVGEVFF